jgi:hypothetical protein
MFFFVIVPFIMVLLTERLFRDRGMLEDPRERDWKELEAELEANSDD